MSCCTSGWTAWTADAAASASVAATRRSVERGAVREIVMRRFSHRGHGRVGGRIGSNTRMKPVNPNGGLVYSTEAGRMCPACRQPVAQCVCKKAVAPPTDGVVRLFFETKGRGGKGVTVVRGLGLAEPELVALGKKLKTACGVGGTAKEGVVELQGDHRDRVMALLQAQGFKNVKKAGG
jgi:translation initiation factor 1